MNNCSRGGPGAQSVLGRCNLKPLYLLLHLTDHCVSTYFAALEMEWNFNAELPISSGLNGKL